MGTTSRTTTQKQQQQQQQQQHQHQLINQLLANGFFHAKKWVVGTSKISFELGKGVDHQFLDCKTLFFGDSRGQTESFDGTSDTNSSRFDWCIWINISLDFINIHV